MQIPVVKVAIYTTSVFIPKTIKIIGEDAFYLCTNLKEVRFEKNSRLNEVKRDAFVATIIVNFDLPSSVTIIDYYSSDYFFYWVSSLKCFSYLGKTDFSNNRIFYNTPTIHVSNDYLSTSFGQISGLIKDGSTCGVSNERFYPEKYEFETFFIRRAIIHRILMFIIFILTSWVKQAIIIVNAFYSYYNNIDSKMAICVNVWEFHLGEWIKNRVDM